MKSGMVSKTMLLAALLASDIPVTQAGAQSPAAAAKPTAAAAPYRFPPKRLSKHEAS